MSVVRRAVRIVKGILDEILGGIVEVVAELLLCLLAAALLGAVGFLATVAWSVSPTLSASGLALFALFSGYGAREAFRAPQRRRKGRLAGAAVVCFGVVAALAYLAFACGCG